MNTFWVTFYSYKGGVGRSMALANVAALLAQQGRRVLLIDFDLEAPGLDSFFELDSLDRPGVVDYTSQYIARHKAPSIKAFVHQCKTPKSLRGKLWLMPSGSKDDYYNAKRRGIDWTDLYDNHQGHTFIENWKADIEQTYRPDYVFIDSRTGLTDVGGICTLHFPALVVLMFSLNEQNLQGITGVAKVLKQAVSGPQILPVATPLPNMPRDTGESSIASSNDRTAASPTQSLLAARLTKAEQLLGTSIDHRIRYHAPAALEERIFVWNNRALLEDEESLRLSWTTPIVEDYVTLKAAITEFDLKGMDFFIRELTLAAEELNEQRAEQLIEAVKSEFSDRGDALFSIAQARRAFQGVSAYKTALYEVLNVEPTHPKALDGLIALHKAGGDNRAVIASLRDALKNEASLLPGRVRSLRGDLGTYLMAEKEYEAAQAEYKRLCKDSSLDKFAEFVYRFNELEARRRLGKCAEPAEWGKLVSMYEKDAAMDSAHEIATRLNRLQAMHIAYACAGQVDNARVLLEEADKLSRSASDRQLVFEVAIYKEVSLPEYREYNNRMRQALTEGRLWDRMTLPVPVTGTVMG